MTTKTLGEWIKSGAVLRVQKSHPWSRDKSKHYQIYIYPPKNESGPAFSNLYKTFTECQTEIDKLMSMIDQED